MCINMSISSRIPKSIMPEVVDCAGSHFQSTAVDIFGVEIPIAACMADQVSYSLLFGNS
jgi:glycerol kinase